MGVLSIVSYSYCNKFQKSNLKSIKMNDLIAKCGCNCSRCPTYKNNLQAIEDRKRCSWGWKKYLNIKLSPEKLRPCDGCSISDDKRKVYYLNCHVRKCAMINGVENCAFCSDYPCREVLNIHSLQKPDAKEKIIERTGASIQQEDYLAFIEPYEGIKHLNEIRQTLGADEIVEMKRFSVRPKILSFPIDLPFSKDKISTYQYLHQIIATLEVSEHISHARKFTLEKNRKQLLKILWAFGRFGELKEEDGSHLMLGSETYSSQKISSYYSKVQDYIGLIAKYGVHCEIVPLQEKGWVTPTGALRNTGWLMKLTIDEKISGGLTVKALKNYAAKLDEKYGKNAFRYFSKGDMQVLIMEGRE
jgi:hypothetical protein